MSRSTCGVVRRAGSDVIANVGATKNDVEALAGLPCQFVDAAKARVGERADDGRRRRILRRWDWSNGC